jgi:hypothetical protein
VFAQYGFQPGRGAVDMTGITDSERPRSLADRIFLYGCSVKRMGLSVRYSRDFKLSRAGPIGSYETMRRFWLEACWYNPVAAKIDRIKSEQTN